MSFNGLLNHKCDIYHMLRSDKSPGYNLPSSPTFSYPEAPDLSAVPCHFNVKGGNLTITQNEPQATLKASIKLVLPTKFTKRINDEDIEVLTDIRINDKIVDCDTGVEYTAETPRNIRGHHIYVMLHRTARQEPL